MQSSYNTNPEIWNVHYQKEKSKLVFPDENLVRILSRIPRGGIALDHGAGSGRHSFLLQSYGYTVIACDYSAKSIDTIKERIPGVDTNLITSVDLPYKDNQFNLVISWGVLHYNTEEDAFKIVSEIKRILKPNGYFVGTVRSTFDTHLKNKEGVIHLKELSGGKVKLYTLDELTTLLRNFKCEFGYMERTPVGKLEERICHWIFQAKN